MNGYEWPIQPRIAIALATYNRPESLKACLRSLQTASASLDARIIVVDNSDDGNARPTVESMDFPVHYAHEREPGIVAARNRSLDELREGEDAVIFIDDDETVAPGWLDNLVACARRLDADVVSGPVYTPLPPHAPRWISRGGFLQRQLRVTGSPLREAATNNVLLSTSAWKACGMPRFDQSFSSSGGSDTDFFSRLADAGASIRYCAEAIVVEGVPEERLTVKWVVRRAFRNGIVRGRIAARKRSRVALLLVGVVRSVFYFGACLVDLVKGRGICAAHLDPALWAAGQVASTLNLRVHEYRR